MQRISDKPSILTLMERHSCSRAHCPANEQAAKVRARIMQSHPLLDLRSRMVAIVVFSGGNREGSAVSKQTTARRFTSRP